MKKNDASGLLNVIGAVLAREASQGTVDGRIVADELVKAAFTALSKPLRARAFTALGVAKRRVDKEARERIELVRG